MSNSTPQKVNCYKVVILGETAVGKSSIAQQFVNKQFSNLHQPTVGALYLTKQIHLEDRIVKLEIWDTAGQERFHSLTPIYYKNAKVAIVVFDISNVITFERAQKWVKELLEKANPGIVICICGNKIDLENQRQVNKEDAEKYANDIGSFYVEVSAKLNMNIDELFKEIIDRLPKFEISESDNIKLGEKVEEKNQSYCGGYCGY